MTWQPYNEDPERALIWINPGDLLRAQIHRAKTDPDGRGAM
jgi:hypothetical protein